MENILFLCVFAYCAGLIVDAAVGGGGLIQIPALFNFLPKVPPVAVFRTNKFISATGTIFATRAYLKRVRLPWRLVLPAAGATFLMSFTGAAVVSLIPVSIIKPMVLVLLVLMAIYTLRKKILVRSISRFRLAAKNCCRG